MNLLSCMATPCARCLALRAPMAGWCLRESLQDPELQQWQLELGVRVVFVDGGSNGELTIYVREPTVDGKANDAIARLLAAHLQLLRSRVELVSGATSRQKHFRVSRCSCFTPGVAVISV